MKDAKDVLVVMILLPILVFILLLIFLLVLRFALLPRLNGRKVCQNSFEFFDGLSKNGVQRSRTRRPQRARSPPPSPAQTETL